MPLVMVVVLTMTVGAACLSAESFSASFRNTVLSQLFVLVGLKYRNLHIQDAIFRIAEKAIKKFIIF